MIVKVDEDLPKDAARLLRARGHDAVTVLEQGMGGWKDAELWRAVQHERRFLITADKGFADVLAFPPGSHSGVLLLRPDKDGIQPILDLLDSVLQSYSLDTLTGAVTVATLRGIRVRRSAP
jgi:predicted nuclease of predicted toxin-antitoxin system